MAQPGDDEEVGFVVVNEGSASDLPPEMWEKSRTFFLVSLPDLPPALRVVLESCTQDEADAVLAECRVWLDENQP